MIALLTGRIEQIEDGRCVVDVNGVGYLVQASTRTLAALPPPPAVARLLVETQVREDAITLFGFCDGAEQAWFRLLTTVQGVGAKVALNLLSALSPDALSAAVVAGDRGALTRAPGVGAKLAVRLLSELRDRVAAMPGGAAIAPGPAKAAAPSIADDALSALLNLGYRRGEAEAAIGRVLAADPSASLDRVIRDGLRELAPG